MCKAGMAKIDVLGLSWFILRVTLLNTQKLYFVILILTFENNALGMIVDKHVHNQNMNR